jgi:hypothetical protein
MSFNRTLHNHSHRINHFLPVSLPRFARFSSSLDPILIPHQHRNAPVSDPHARQDSDVSAPLLASGSARRSNLSWKRRVSLHFVEIFAL